MDSVVAVLTAHGQQVAKHTLLVNVLFPEVRATAEQSPIDPNFPSGIARLLDLDFERLVLVFAQKLISEPDSAFAVVGPDADDQAGDLSIRIPCVEHISFKLLGWHHFLLCKKLDAVPSRSSRLCESQVWKQSHNYCVLPSQPFAVLPNLVQGVNSAQPCPPAG